ncbi:mitochondrial distribution and morphology protein 10 [Xylona heveae TC161]|uniref:Mitochondrial distribution and morphology protein 10 n=1 Tax=Xylona heveae (strain CBS 132557 / TC161) TaxID=1328760 RepID=A0A165JTM7_XYLHT|nr:mitochondrial distribution and morphology protein 10 [Xylona heveae TC161]KZF26611.1 mitochondrial distribution and morphology protein 10 [Xylona heveae TC161]
MLGFMDYVQYMFFKASRWNQDNNYGSLNATAQALLDFETPRGLRLNVSSLSSPNFATSYNLGSVGLVDGSLSYLYSSLPLKDSARSRNIDLHDVIQGYRHLQELQKPEEAWLWEIWHRGRRIDRRDTLLYGRLYLPDSTLEALYLRRLSPTRQLKLSCVSDSRLKNGGTILGLLQHDVGKYNMEYLYSSDSALLGIRGLYNFGPDPRKEPTIFPPEMPDTLKPSEQHTSSETVSSSSSSSPSPSSHGPYGRFSAGAELYYGILNKSGGISTGIRFTTLPRHTGFPYTMTLTLNPLMGNLSSTYAVKAGPSLALCSRFGFNFYSYESDLQLGCELWRLRQPRQPTSNLDWVYAKLGKEHEAEMVSEALRPGTKQARHNDNGNDNDDVAGVLKARVDQNCNVGVLWEGRIKDLLFSAGVSLDLRARNGPFRAIGVELQYSS